MLRSLSILFVITALSVSASASAAGPQALVRIDQLSPSAYGSWTLLSADGSARRSTDAGIDVTGKFSAAVTEFGQTTLSVSAPPGMSAIISVYQGSEFLKEIALPQYSFTLYANSDYRFLIKYSISRVGSLGVTSDPASIRFRVKGPTRRIYSAKTPYTFKNLPAGKYSIYFPKTAECLQPAVQTIDVQPGERNTSHIALMCDAVGQDDGVDRSRVSKRTLYEYVKARELKKRGQRK